jgi:cytochrome P450
MVNAFAAAERSLGKAGLNPFPEYKHMRETDPLSYDAERNMWHMYRYKDCLEMMTQPQKFSSQRGVTITTEEQQKQMSLIITDPPRHRQLRALVSQAFTPRIIEQMESDIRITVDELLDAVLDKGQMDIIDDLAYPLPVIVIARMLGVPPEDRANFKKWSDDVVSISEEKSIAGRASLYTYFQQQVIKRRENYQDDLVGRLLKAQIDGQLLSETEIVVFCALLMTAGNETTTNLIGNALWCFDEQPEVWQQLRADRSLLPGAIEEVLRFRSPSQHIARAATEDIEFGGQQIKAGQVVIGWTGAANRDEAQFPDAEVFDIRRSPNRHLAFGHGIHFCLGAHLARLEAKLALEGLLERFSEVRRRREVPLQPVESYFALGVEHFPVTLKR